MSEVLTREERVALSAAAMRNGDLHEQEKRSSIPFLLCGFSYDAELGYESRTSYRSMKSSTH